MCSTETEKKRYEFDKYIPAGYFRAVVFAKKMIEKGMPFFFAVSKASYHYKIDEFIIINYLPETIKQENKETIKKREE